MGSWVHLDDALMKLGRFGQFQLRLYLGVCLVAGLAASWNLFNHVFIAYVPEHRCRVPELDDEPTGQNISHFFPCVDVEGESECLYDYCRVFNRSSSEPNVTQKCPNGIIFDDTYFKRTIISRWDLVCGEEVKDAVTYALLSAGFVTGGLFFTTLSDIFGRKAVGLGAQMGLAVVGVVQPFLPEYYSFTVFQFLRGNLMQGVFLTAVVMITEMLPSNMRILGGVISQLCICLGMMLLAGLAYGLRDYVWIMFSTSIPFVFSFLLYWVVPESVPWLVTNNRKEEAADIMKRAAAMNGVEIPQYMFDSLFNGETKDTADQNANGSTLKRETSVTELMGVETNEKTVGLCEMFSKSRKLLIYLVASLIYWFLLPTVYYGITLNTSNLAGDVFLNFFLLSVVELPSALVCVFLLPRFGRKKTLYIVHALPTVGLVIMVIEKIVPHGYDLATLEIVLSMIVKFGASSAFLIALFFTPEIFPTPVRNTIAGFCATLGTLTNILVPFIIQLGLEPGLSFLPYFIFVICMVISGFTVIFMPETLGRPMPQTAEEVEAWETGVCCGNTPDEPGQISKSKKRNSFINLQPNDVQVDQGTYKAHGGV